MSDDLNEAFLQRLRQLRAHFKITQEQLAERAGLDYKHYQKIESGAKSEIRFSTLVKIARGFKISIRDLFSEDLPRLAAEHSSGKASRAKKKTPPRRKR